MSGRLTADLVGRSITLVRTFDAPRDLVFEAFTRAEHLAAWWGPQGFTNPVCEVESKVGGKINIHMRGPDGTISPMRGVFRELAAPERIVFLAGVDGPDGKPFFETLNTITLAAEGKRTKLTLRAEVVTAEPGAAVPIAGMEPGWAQSLDRLQGHVAPTQVLRPRDIVTTRTFDAPRDPVFRAWTEPGHVSRWWGPNGFRSTIHEMDIRPGGKWSLTMHGPDGTDYRNESLYLNVVRPSLIVSVHNTAPKFLSVIMLEEAGSGTRVTMMLQFFSDEDLDAAVNVFGAVEGAGQTLERLGAHLKEM